MKPDFTRKLLEWHSADNNRSMPWKGENDPYRIWLSEIILQQTRVEQGVSYYQKFISAYPTVLHLASAPEQEIFKMWEGLGYYSRCRNLIATAKFIKEYYNGVFPSTYNEILSLTGVGPYTAAAISSFAFNLPHAVVDGNVHRVLARYFGISTPIDSKEGKRLFNDLATALLDTDSPATYNQAIMDFGATVCRPRAPLCSACVQNSDCEAYLNGYTSILPVKEKVLKTTSRWMYYFVLQHHDSVYIRKRSTKDIWQNLHEFVLHESAQEIEDAATSVLPELIQQQTYLVSHISSTIKQRLTHQRIHGQFFIVNLQQPASLPEEYMLVKKINLNGYAFPRIINEFLEANPL